MINLNELRNKKIGIFGLGKTGIATLRAFSIIGAHISVWDDNNHQIEQFYKRIKNYENIKCFNFIDEKQLEDIDFMVISPGVPCYLPKPHDIFYLCKKNGIPILTDIDILFHACQKANYIGITGTNGKSTTAALIKHILNCNKIKAYLGGNIGIPVLSLPQITTDQGSYVLELSSYQLDLMSKYKFNIAVLLSIVPDHLDWYGTVNKYRDAKLKIFDYQDQKDFSVISLDSDINKRVYKKLSQYSRQNIITVSSKKILQSGISLVNSCIYDNFFQKKCREIFLPSILTGRFSSENIVTAYTVSRILKTTEENFLSSLKTFKGLSHRMEVFLKTKNITFVDDSKATNIESTKQALKSFDNIYWILGGVFKETGTRDLGNYLKTVKHCYLIGRDFTKFIPMLEKKNVSYSICNTLENAVLQINLDISKGTVLLSPCCASFDQWKNFEDRGITFKKLVMKIFK